MVVSASPKPSVGLTTISTGVNPVEEFCAIGSLLSIELKGKRYHTRMRGAKAEFITTNIMGGKPRLTSLPETSFILADMPKDYAAARFEYNSPLTVRFLLEGSVYAFKTMLIRVHGQPPVLVLEYPNEVQRYNMRSSERVNIISPAEVARNGGPDHQMGAVLDISTSGARIGLEAKNGINVGDKIHVSFKLSNGQDINHLSAVVRSIDEENGKYLLGIGFLGSDDAISAFCKECADFVSITNPAAHPAMLELQKEAMIEFDRKSGKVVVRGYKEGANGYILTEKPQGQLPPLSIGKNAVIRVENRGTIYGMAVTYKDFLKRTDLCYFPFHEDVVSHSLRSEERVVCQQLATIKGIKNESDAPQSGVIVNLGKGGLRFATRGPIEAKTGDEVLMSFYPGGIGFIDRLRMRLMRVNNHEGQFEYATQFIDMEKEQQELLDSYFAFCRNWMS